MKEVLAATSKGLLSAGALLMISGAAFAQALPLDHEVGAFYSATPHEDEMLVRTREECGWFIPRPDAATAKTVPDIAQRLINNWKRYSWEGVCYQGLALGPGRLLIYGDKGELVSISQAWALNGRGIGLGLNTTLASEHYDVGLTQAVNWKGTSFSRNVRDVAPLEPAGDRQYPPSVGFDPPDRRKAVRYTLAGPLAETTPAKVVQMSLTDKFLETGNYFDRLTNFPCPTGCGALWVEKAGPLIRGFDEFERRHAAEIAAVKASLVPVLTPLLAQQLHDLQAAQKPAAPVASGVTTHSAAKGRM